MAKKGNGKTQNAMVETRSTALMEQEAPPQYIQALEGRAEGLENVRGSDFIIPRVELMQALSPEVEQEVRLKGELVDSLTKEVLWRTTEEPLRMIPIFHWLQWIRWGDREKNEGIQEQSIDPKSKLAMQASRFTTDIKGNLIATEYHNFLVLLPQASKFPYLLNCCRTNHKKGKFLLTLARHRGQFPLFAGAYALSSENETNKKNQTYKVFCIDNAGWATEEEMECARGWHGESAKAYENNALQVDIEQSNQDYTTPDISEETEI